MVWHPTNHTERAFRPFEKAIELKPDYAHVWFNRACSYAFKGNKENALSNLKKAVELDASLKEEAKKDQYSKALQNNKDFKELIK